MGRMYKHGENDLFGMRADILKKEGTSLAEIGLLVLLLYNNDKDYNEALENICDDEATIDSAMQMLIRQDLGEAYSFLFDESTELYNAKQKRNSRKIHGSYFEHQFHQKPSTFVITSRDRRKNFYEDIVQIGNKDDSGIDSEDFDLVAECLKEYMQGFQEHNPNFYVFDAVPHLDPLLVDGDITFFKAGIKQHFLEGNLILLF